MWHTVLMFTPCAQKYLNFFVSAFQNTFKKYCQKIKNFSQKKTKNILSLLHFIFTYLIYYFGILFLLRQNATNIIFATRTGQNIEINF